MARAVRRYRANRRASGTRGGKAVSPQRHRDTEEHIDRKAAARVRTAASSPAFESTEVAESAEKHIGALAVSRGLTTWRRLSVCSAETRLGVPDAFRQEGRDESRPSRQKCLRHVVTADSPNAIAVPSVASAISVTSGSDFDFVFSVSRCLCGEISFGSRPPCA
jgi:hypothetical protein